MVKKCIYCSAVIEGNRVVDMCQPCMYQVWGEKMAKAIVANMESERDRGNLELGRVGDSDVVQKVEVVEIAVEESVVGVEAPRQEEILGFGPAEPQELEEEVASVSAPEIDAESFIS